MVAYFVLEISAIESVEASSCDIAYCCSNTSDFTAALGVSSACVLEVEARRTLLPALNHRDAAGLRTVQQLRVVLFPER